jgi:hypothetical protein
MWRGRIDEWGQHTGLDHDDNLGRHHDQRDLYWNRLGE